MTFAARTTTNVCSCCTAIIVLAATLAASCGDDDTDGHSSHRADASVADANTPAVAGKSYRIQIEVKDVPPGTEGTKCMKVSLGNASPIKVGRVHNQLFGQSHHFIVSSVTDAAATAEGLYDCTPFRAPLTGAPLTITQKHDEQITLPHGVGYALGADQLMHLELHYINTTSETADVRAESELFVLDDDTDIQEAGFLIAGSMDIAIPPHSSHTTGDVYLAAPEALSGVHYYAITGHTHQFGKNVKVSVAEDAKADGTTIYELSSFDWSAPEVRYFDPPIEVPSGGGFRFSCDWDNPTDQTVKYGESAMSEMCFFWAYYYPKSPKQQTLIYMPQRTM